VLTAIANDYGYDQCFEKQVEAFVKDGDLVFGLSTSGNSTSIINAIVSAGKKGAKTIAFTGKDGGRLKELVDVCPDDPILRYSSYTGMSYNYRSYPVLNNRERVIWIISKRL
jgi:DNA-binding MurR/RpiR family transcriptional regulator